MRKISSLLLLLLIVSCGLLIKNNSEKKETQDSQSKTGQIWKQNPATQKETQYTRDHHIQFTMQNGKEIVHIGKALLADVVIDQELVKTNGDSYILSFKSYNTTIQNVLNKQGIKIGNYIPHNSVVVKSRLSLGKLRELPALEYITPYEPFLKISRSDGDWKAVRKARVTLWENEDGKTFKSFCQSNSIAILSGSDNEYIVSASNIKPLLFSDSVLRLEKYKESSVFSFTANRTIQTIDKYWTNYQYNTTGSRISVFDMGIDQSQADLFGAIGSVTKISGSGETGELVTHGTHIAGIIAGRGVNSTGDIKGVNPDSTIRFYAMGDDLKGLMVPASMQDSFNHSLKNRSDIANLSWGTYDDNLEGKYLSISRDIDEYVYRHPEFIVVTAAGNNGKSIASPGTGKNVITVGALDGANLAQFTPQDYCYDGRIKPEITVQGVGIESLDLHNTYKTLNGTSQSAAIVSGLISRIYTQIQNLIQDKPTHSMVKSYLIANTLDESPSKGYGYGKLYFNQPLNQEHFKLAHFRDVSELKAINKGVKEGDDITVVLTWTDPPSFEGSFYNLINQFDLIIETTAGTYRVSDGINNSVKTVLKSLKAGEIKITVIPVTTPLSTSDLSITIKSRLGFETNSVKIENADNTASWPSENNSDVDFTTGKVVQIPSGTVNYGGGLQNAELTMVNTMASTGDDTLNNSTDNPPIQTALSSLNENPFSALDSGIQSNSSDSIHPIKLFSKYGDNTYFFRALGLANVQFLQVNLNIPYVSNSTLSLPVQDASNLESAYYQEIKVDVNSLTNLAGNLLVRDNDSGQSNLFPVTIHVDGQPPFLGSRYPSDGDLLTNTTAWIELIDTDSGVNSNFVISVNGIFLSPLQYQYNYGNNKLTIALDKLFPMQNRDVTVKFISLSDNAGNAANNLRWVFQYNPVTDSNPPEKPAGLTIITNRPLKIRWTANSEKDLLGYKIYRFQEDGFTSIPESDIIQNNYYYFQGSHSGMVGVSAFDASSNESFISTINVTKPFINPPEIIIENVPERTNGTVIAKIQVKTDGVIIEDLVKLSKDGNTNPVSLDWVSNFIGGVLHVNSYLTNEASGNYNLWIAVEDDDGNRSTNEIQFLIDKNLPEAPQNFTIGFQERTANLSWNSVFKNGLENNYHLLVSRNSWTTNMSGITTNQVSLSLPDYGTYRFSLSTVDTYGNESAPVTKMMNSERGIAVSLTDIYLNNSLNFTGMVRISTNAYNRVLIALSNQNGSKSWTILPAFELNAANNVTDLPDGNYRFSLLIESNGNSIDPNNRYFQTVTIDHTKPRFIIVDQGITQSGNVFVSKSDKVDLFVIDRNLDYFTLEQGNSSPMGYTTNRVTIPLKDSIDFSVTAYDKAKNASFQNFSISKDNIPPVIRVTGISEYIEGTVTDENLKNYKVYTNGGLYYTSEFSADGRVCALPIRSGTIEITAEDIAGNNKSFITNVNKASGLTNHFTGILLNGTNTYYHNQSTVEFTLTGTVNSAVGYELYTNKSLYLSSGMIYDTRYLTSGLKDGLYTIEVYGDRESLSKDFYLSTVSPIIRLAGEPEIGKALKDLIRIENKVPYQADYYINQSKVNSNYQLGIGSQTLSVHVLDLAGNTAEWSRYLQLESHYSNVMLAHFSDERLRDNGYYNHPVAIELTDPVTVTNIRVNGMPYTGALFREGVYTIQVSGEDRQPTNTIYANALRITIDTTPPSIYSTVTSNIIVNELPTVYFDDLYLKSSNIQIDGVDLSKIQGAVMDGQHVLTAWALDMAGNSNSFSVGFTMDTEMPAITIAPESGVYQSVTPVIHVSKNVDYRAALNNGPFNKNQTINQEGDYTLVVSVVDSAESGNVARKTYSIDKTPPTLQFDVSEGQIYLTNHRIEFQANDIHLSNYTCDLDGLPYTGSGITMEGPHLFHFKALDQAGNTSETNIKFTISATYPYLVLSGYENCIYYQGVYFTNASVGIKSSFGNGVLQGLKMGINGNWQNTNMVSMNNDGDYIVSAIAGLTFNDSVITLTNSLRLNIDRTAPVLSHSGVSDGVFYNSTRQISASAVDHPTNTVMTLTETNTGSVITPDGAGEWSVESDGNYLLSLSATDIFGRTTGSQTQFTVDLTMPSVSVLMNGLNARNFYSNQTLDYSINVSDLYLTNVSIFWNGQAAGTTGTINSLGTNAVSVTARDLAGNVNQTNLLLILDPYAPVITISQFTDRMVVQNADINLDFADSYIHMWDFKAYRNGSLYRTVPGTSPSNYNEIFDQEGEYQLNAKASDKAGNQTLTNWYFSVDQTPPQLFVRFVADHGYYSTNVNPQLSCFDPHFKTNYAVVDGVTVHTSPLSNISASITTEGVHTLTYYAEDLALNWKETNLTFTIDLTPPSITFNTNTIINNGWYNTDKTVNLTVSDLNLLNYQVLNNGEEISNLTAFTNGNTVQIQFRVTEEGLSHITVNAHDLANNISTADFSFMIDKTAPTIQASAGADSLTNGSVYYTNGNLTEWIAALDPYFGDFFQHPSTVTLYTNGTLVSSYSSSNGLMLNNSGNYIIQVHAVDFAGNTADYTNTLILDKEAPVVTFSGLTNDGNYNRDITLDTLITDQNLDQSACSITTRYSAISPHSTSVIGNVSGAYYLTQNFSQEGYYNVQAGASDYADNSANQSVSFVIDKQAPLIAYSGISDGSVIAGGSLSISAVDQGPSGVDYFISSVQKADLQGNSTNLGSLTNSQNIVIGYSQIIEDGVYTITTHSFDKAGNNNSNQIRFTLDKSAPEVAFIFDSTVTNAGTYIYDLVNGFSFNYEVLVRDLCGISSFTLNTNGSELTNITITESDSNRILLNLSAIPFQDLKTGRIDLTFTAVDIAGNTTTYLNNNTLNKVSYHYTSTVKPNIRFQLVNPQGPVYNNYASTKPFQIAVSADSSQGMDNADIIVNNIPLTNINLINLGTNAANFYYYTVNPATNVSNYIYPTNYSEILNSGFWTNYVPWGNGYAGGINTNIIQLGLSTNYSNCSYTYGNQTWSWVVTNISYIEQSNYISKSITNKIPYPVNSSSSLTVKVDDIFHHGNSLTTNSRFIIDKNPPLPNFRHSYHGQWAYWSFTDDKSNFEVGLKGWVVHIVARQKNWPWSGFSDTKVVYYDKSYGGAINDAGKRNNIETPTLGQYGRDPDVQWGSSGSINLTWALDHIDWYVFTFYAEDNLGNVLYTSGIISKADIQ